MNETTCSNSNEAVSIACDEYYEQTQKLIYTDDKGISCVEYS